MELFLAIVFFILGLGVIIKGGDAFVEAARWVSEVTGIPKMIVGATIVSIATTLPELFVSSIAVANGSVGMATGNAIGSVIANIGMGLSISLITMPIVINPRSFNSKAVLMGGSTLILWVFTLDGRISVKEGIFLLALLALFFYLNIKTISPDEGSLLEERPVFTRPELFKKLCMFFLGAVGIVVGADLLVDNGTVIARAMGVSESVIGLTIIAIGTSLPEIATAITAAIKKEPSLSIGNIIGANIIDLTMILPVCSFISGGTLEVPASTTFIDIPVALLLIGIAIIPTLLRRRFSKAQGYCLLGAYFGYLVYIMAF